MLSASCLWPAIKQTQTIWEARPIKSRVTFGTPLKIALTVHNFCSNWGSLLPRNLSVKAQVTQWVSLKEQRHKERIVLAAFWRMAFLFFHSGSPGKIPLFPTRILVMISASDWKDCAHRHIPDHFHYQLSPEVKKKSDCTLPFIC